MEKFKLFIIGLFYENDSPSLTRVLSLIFAISFLLGTGYLLLSGIVWQHYETFATLTAGGGTITQVANKFVNSKYNSEPGKFPEKGGT